jgi:hypothetical protein
MVSSIIIRRRRRHHHHHHHHHYHRNLIPGSGRLYFFVTKSVSNKVKKIFKTQNINILNPNSL